jgi:hypothetical protein
MFKTRTEEEIKVRFDENNAWYDKQFRRTEEEIKVRFDANNAWYDKQFRSFIKKLKVLAVPERSSRFFAEDSHNLIFHEGLTVEEISKLQVSCFIITDDDFSNNISLITSLLFKNFCAEHITGENMGDDYIYHNF